MVLLVSLGAVDPPQVAGVTSLQKQTHVHTGKGRVKQVPLAFRLVLEVPD